MNDLENKPIATTITAPNYVQTLVLIAVTALGIYICYRMAAPFLPAIAGALTLAVLFTPMQRWFESKLKHPSLSALISILLIAAIVLVPSVLVLQPFVEQAAKGADKVASGEWHDSLQAQPRMASFINTIEQQLDLHGTVKDLTSWLSVKAGSFVKGSVFQIIGVCMTFYLLFFFPARWTISSAIDPVTVTIIKNRNEPGI